MSTASDANGLTTGPHGEVGARTFLPEPFYFFADSLPEAERVAARRAFLREAVRVTAQAVSRWADRYWAMARVPALVSAGEFERTGPLPADDRARAVVIEDIFDWFDRHSAPLETAAGLTLYRGDDALLAQQDGLPGRLIVTPEQFAQVRDAWVADSLPRDIYFRERELRVVIEPVEAHGGVVRAYRAYSPVRWEHRDPGAAAARRVPSDEERVEVFAAACARFREAALLRLAELAEPGSAHDEHALRRLAQLVRDVNAAALRAHDSLVPDVGTSPVS